jgi:endonuclease/exonuclease/phosphatase family metal-dependent hydrolase
MERLYSEGADIATGIAGDFNTDPTDPRFASEQTFALFHAQGFEWSWQNALLPERVTLPAKAAIRMQALTDSLSAEVRTVSCKTVAIQGVSDHFPAILTIEID